MRTNDQTRYSRSGWQKKANGHRSSSLGYDSDKQGMALLSHFIVSHNISFMTRPENMALLSHGFGADIFREFLASLTTLPLSDCNLCCAT